MEFRRGLKTKSVGSPTLAQREEEEPANKTEKTASNKTRNYSSVVLLKSNEEAVMEEAMGTIT